MYSNESMHKYRKCHKSHKYIYKSIIFQVQLFAGHTPHRGIVVVAEICMQFLPLTTGPWTTPFMLHIWQDLTTTLGSWLPLWHLRDVFVLGLGLSVPHDVMEDQQTLHH